MATLITVLLVLTATVLGFFILIQAPKGGGLTGNFGSMSTQMMGVKQSGNVMEKGTWAAIALIAVLCVASVAFIEVRPAADRPEKNDPKRGKTEAPAAQQSAGQSQQPAKPAAPAP